MNSLSKQTAKFVHRFGLYPSNGLFKLWLHFKSDWHPNGKWAISASNSIPFSVLIDFGFSIIFYLSLVLALALCDTEIGFLVNHFLLLFDRYLYAYNVQIWQPVLSYFDIFDYAKSFLIHNDEKLDSSPISRVFYILPFQPLWSFSAFEKFDSLGD